MQETGVRKPRSAIWMTYAQLVIKSVLRHRNDGISHVNQGSPW